MCATPLSLGLSKAEPWIQWNQPKSLAASVPHCSFLCWLVGPQKNSTTSAARATVMVKSMCQATQSKWPKLKTTQPTNQKVFSKCKACHKVEDGANGTGPHLFNVVDRGIGDEPGFEYSAAMAGFEGNWDVETLNAFLIRPASYINGTKMSFAGLKKEMDRANLIKYLETLK